MNLDELIAKLTDIRDQHGGTMPVVMIEDGNTKYDFCVSLAQNEQGYLLEIGEYPD